MIVVLEKALGKINNDFMTALDEQMFKEAREYFCENPARRNELIRAIAMDGSVFYLKWVKNQIDPIFYVDDFWDYDDESDLIDDEILRRADAFVFYQYEEYSFIVAKIIRRLYPEKVIFFMDSKATRFFSENNVKIVSSWKEIYSGYYYLCEKRVMIVSSKLDKPALNPWKREHTTLSIMASLFWARKIISYGERNQDKIILNLCYPLAGGGMVDLIKFPLFIIHSVSGKIFMGKEIVPYIDFTSPMDKNMFVKEAGQNAWLVFFEQISGLTKEEVYSSKYVINIEHKLNWYNLYIMQTMAFMPLSKLIRSYLVLNENTKNAIDSIVEKTFPLHGKILGVKARGTDYLRVWKTVKDSPPANPNELLSAVEKKIKEEEYDYVFLATEDQDYVDHFLKGDLRDRIVMTDAFRMSGKQNKKAIAADVREQNDDLYKQNILYLAEIRMLSMCDALISNMDCGAVQLAVALNDGKYNYTFTVKGS